MLILAGSGTCQLCATCLTAVTDFLIVFTASASAFFCQPVRPCLLHLKQYLYADNG